MIAAWPQTLMARVIAAISTTTTAFTAVFTGRPVRATSEKTAVAAAAGFSEK